MKKIKTLFERKFEGHKIVGITDKLTDEAFQVVLDGLAVPTVKYDGSCCWVHDGELYRRYDCKKGKTPPAGAIPCDDPDPITGHWPHWVKCDKNNPSDKWFLEAFACTRHVHNIDYDYTFEAIGKHFNGNPYGCEYDKLVPHGCDVIQELSFPEKPTFESIKKWLKTHNQEGIVFWYGFRPLCKIKRTDFGFEWPIKEE